LFLGGGDYGINEDDSLFARLVIQSRNLLQMKGANEMPKILDLWEADMSKLPIDPNERAALWGKQIETTKKMLEEGRIYDWGIFSGGSGGYGISPADATAVLKNVMRFTPYIKFKSHLVLSIDEVAEVMKSFKA